MIKELVFNTLVYSGPICLWSILFRLILVEMIVIYKKILPSLYLYPLALARLISVNFQILITFAPNKNIHMKNLIIILTLFLISFIGFGQKKKDLIEEVAQLEAQAVEMQTKLSEIQKAKELNLKDSLQNFSYAFGVSVGNNLKTIGFDSLSYNVVVIALEDVIQGNEKISIEDAQSSVQVTIQAMLEREAKEKSAEGERFLAENRKRPEVVTTKSGLQYEILKEGDGPLPKASDKVKVHYSGMLINEKVFDSSVENGEPAVLQVTQVIKGWQEALQLMPVGSKWKIFVPQDIGYGPRGAGGGIIPPYAALIFEMELLAIEK